MNNNSSDNLRESFVSGSGRRFASDAPKDFHYTSFETKNLLRSYSPEATSPLLYRKASFVELEPHAVYSKDRLWVSFYICSGTSGHRYVLKDIIELLRSIDNHETVSYGKHLEFTHNMSAFSDTSQKLINFLFGYFREHQLRDNSLSLVQRGSISYTYARGHAKQIELFGHEIDNFLECLSEVYFQNTDFHARYTDERLLEISPVFPPIDLHIEKDKNGITFESGSFTMFEGYSYIYFERRRKLHRFPRESAREVLPFLKFLSSRRTENELFISDKDLTLFSTGLFPVLDEFFNVSCDGFEPAKYAPDLPKFRLYLDLPDPYTLTCDIQAVYFEDSGHETCYRVFEPRAKEPDAMSLLSDTSRQPRRSLYLENQAAKAVSQYFDRLDENEGLLLLEDKERGGDR
ncbi:MAG: SNF2 helicase associated domain-containing protein, partial [Firmicutes bacterium]|nr:SNF2 helicase associated domain-containing protein [Bacillota bacterium]